MGEGIWKTELETGGCEWEITLDDAELAELQAEAAVTGLTEDQVLRWRLLGDSVMIETFTRRLDMIVANLRILCAAFTNITGNQAQLTKHAATIAALTSNSFSEIRALAPSLAIAEDLAHRYQSQAMLAQIAVLRAEIDNTMRRILETATIITRVS